MGTYLTETRSMSKDFFIGWNFVRNEIPATLILFCDVAHDVTQRFSALIDYFLLAI
jgi:hypothetical protein